MDMTDLIPSGVKRAVASKVARWAGTLAGGAVAGFVFSHTNVLSVLNQACASLSSPEAMTTAFGGLAVAAATLVFSVKDAKRVDAKMTVAAAAGVSEGHALAQAQQQAASEQRETDQTLVGAVAKAIATADKATPADKASLVESLKGGTF